MTQIIATGAESEIHKINNTTVKKIRLAKTYRIPEIDIKLRRLRNRKEFKILKKLHDNNILVPKPYKLIEDKRIDEISFEFEFLDGQVLKKCLTKELLFRAFSKIIEIHKQEITHSDLTTLNMIYYKKEIYLIDFGLADFSIKAEDRAVDLNLFFNCIKNEHPEFYGYKEELKEIYFKYNERVLHNLEKLEHRGRNKNK
jgi:TP53 regulating kinase-like protein